MILFLSRLFKTLVSARGLLLLVSTLISWFLITYHKEELSAFSQLVFTPWRYVYVAILLFPLVSFVSELLFEVFYKKIGDLTNVATLVLCAALVIISFLGGTLLSITAIDRYLFIIILYLAPVSMTIYKAIMALMELFYRLRLGVLGTESL